MPAERRNVTIDEIVATFSEHLAKHYPPPKEFRRNFELLLEGKRGRGGEERYAVTIEKNIAFLACVVEEAEALLAGMLDPAREAPAVERIPAALEEIEKRAHERTAARHREAFVEGTAREFEELRKDRAAGGPGYAEKLEFNYRYLMTLRIFISEFISVLAAIRARYGLAAAVPAPTIRGQLELTAHYYLGNVAVGKREAAAKAEDSKGPANTENAKGAPER